MFRLRKPTCRNEDPTIPPPKKNTSIQNLTTMLPLGQATIHRDVTYCRAAPGPETCDGDPAPPSEPQAAQAGSRSPRAPSPAPLAQGHHGPGGREEGPGHVRGVMTALPASQAPTGHQLPRLGPALPLCCPRHTPAQPCPTPFQSRAPQSWNPHHISPATHLLPPPLLCIHLLNHSQSTRTPAPNASPPPAGLPCCSEPGFCGACLGPSPETQPLHGTVTRPPPGPISRKEQS